MFMRFGGSPDWAYRKGATTEMPTDNAPSRNAPRSLEPMEATGMIVVNVERGTVGGVVCEVVDGRELHAKIGTKANFRKWIQDRIRQLKFVENLHFERFEQICSKPGRPLLSTAWRSKQRRRSQWLNTLTKATRCATTSLIASAFRTKRRATG
ncbi:antA/AntB antirepressor family protein [Paraburkholderia aromaticivorans]|uniref:antA/AntB antirepressor family protein n=1 Tax=Paraburkholderia aromaticivorans TaxID=2026199 RepID=UPI00145609BA|nr:antA/AntB antirepressor family protein [Paraburkholderia aromaticivorans]